jgi:hypothetical protein
LLLLHAKGNQKIKNKLIMTEQQQISVGCHFEYNQRGTLEKGLKHDVASENHFMNAFEIRLHLVLGPEQ